MEIIKKKKIKKGNIFPKGRNQESRKSSENEVFRELGEVSLLRSTEGNLGSLRLSGQNPVFSAVFLVLVFVIGAGIVLTVGLPSIDQATSVSKFNDAMSMVKILDNAIREVVSEGPGTKRLVKFFSPGEFEVVPQEESIQFKMQGPEIIEHLSRKVIGNIVQIGGSDVTCSDTVNLTMENSFVRVEIRNVAETTPNSAINTNETLMAIKEKLSGTTITLVNSSVVIDGDTTTTNGTGFSRLLRKGNGLPSCTAHVFVNSTADYDVYYTLYAGADFLVVDVRHVR